MFEVGDKVVIARMVRGRHQRDVIRDIPGWALSDVDDKWKDVFVKEMFQFIGKEDVIYSVNPVSHEVRLKNTEYNWSILSFDKVKGEEEMKKENLFNLYRDELYDLARKKNIPGRGSMTKAELIVALSDPIIKKEEKPKKTLGVKLNRLIKNNATCHYAFRNGEIESFYNDDICHARLRADKMDEIVLNVKKHYDNHPDQNAYKWYVEWMLNDSPFSKCFITKKWKDAYEDGVYLDCNYSISRLVASAIALRGGSEFVESLSLHHTFVKDGYNPSLSWFLSYQFKKEGDKWYFSGDGGGAHKVFSVNVANAENMCKFIKEGFHLYHNDKPANKHGHEYSIFTAVHGEYVAKEELMSDRIYNTFNIKKAIGFGEAVERISNKKFNEGFSKLEAMIFN